MGRASKRRTLAVLLNGEQVGLWSVDGAGRHEFRYDAAWLDSPAARPLSLSLPLVPPELPYTGETVAFFFDNLLPDNADIRRRVQRRFGAASTSAFDLLSEVGRDCVGAVQLVPPDAATPDLRRMDGVELDEEGVAAALRSASGTAASAGTDDDFRISIAGAQEKTALLKIGDTWYRPLGATATTHILKLPLGPVGTSNADMSASVENEWLCSRLVGAFGFPAAACAMESFADQKALVVERFDRRLSRDGSWWIRLPQEDFCQALGVSGARKYENEGGPGIEAGMNLLLGAKDPASARRFFFGAQLLFWLLAAPDGHGKNFSLFIGKGGRYEPTPLYDVMSAYPVMGNGPGRIPRQKLRMAMAVSGKNRHYEWTRIRRRHWAATARRSGFGTEFEAAAESLVARTPAAIERVCRELPPGFPSSISEPIFAGLESAARGLLEDRDP